MGWPFLTGGGGSSSSSSAPFESSAGVITKDTAGDQVRLQSSGADEYQLRILRGAAPGTANIIEWYDQTEGTLLGAIEVNGAGRFPAGSTGGGGTSTYGVKVGTAAGFASVSNAQIMVLNSGYNVAMFSGASGGGPAMVMQSIHGLGWVSGSDLTATPDTFFIRGGAAATLQLGAADAASPVAQTLRAQGSRAGTDTNVGGANLTITSGNGTGTGTISALILSTPMVTGSGTGAQTMTPMVKIAGTAAAAMGATQIAMWGGTGNAGGIFINAGGQLLSGYTSNHVADVGWQASGAGRWVPTNGSTGAGDVAASKSVLTSGTMTQALAHQSLIRRSVTKFTWTNAQVVALGATTAGDITVCTLPAKTIVVNAYLVVDTQAAGTTTLTGAVGRTGATYIDYIVASDLKAAANTVYGDASGERGTNLTGYDLPSYTGTTNVVMHFISTGANLDQVTTCTGTVILETATLP